MATVFELIKLFAFALVVTLVFVIGRELLSALGTNQHATGFAVIRAEGYSVMIVGFFVIVLGFVITRMNLVAGPDGRPRFTLR